MMMNINDELPEIIAVDFDGTLCQNEYPNIGAPFNEVIDYVKHKQQNCQCKLILLTMREYDLLDAAVEWCRRQGIEFDAVNDNLQELQDFYGNNPRKVFANTYIDDSTMLHVNKQGFIE